MREILRTIESLANQGLVRKVEWENAWLRYSPVGNLEMHIPLIVHRERDHERIREKLDRHVGPRTQIDIWQTSKDWRSWETKCIIRHRINPKALAAMVLMLRQRKVKTEKVGVALLGSKDWIERSAKPVTPRMGKGGAELRSELETFMKTDRRVGKHKRKKLVKGEPVPPSVYRPPSEN